VYPRWLRSLSTALLACSPILLAACGTSAAQPASSKVVAAAAPLVHFPADQAGHPDAANEWWYVVGHVRHNHRLFGYEVTIFKFLHLNLPGTSTPVTIYRTDVAITSQKPSGFHQNVTYYFPQSAHVSNSTLDVHVGGASLVANANNDMVLKGSLQGGALSMNLHSRRTPMYVGGRGYLPFGNQFTYYYSLTDLATHGTIRLKGVDYTVSGISWLDHQWGNWNWSTVKGWTWMALQLKNGVQMSVFDFRSQGNRQRAASVITPNGVTHTIHKLTIASTGTWRSPHTGGLYPSGWIVTIPSLRARFTVTPALKDQELAVPGQNFGSYWEGSGKVNGTYGGKPVKGQSYTELTGYAGR
jgi:predicted secreted hydrolase